MLLLCILRSSAKILPEWKAWSEDWHKSDKFINESIAISDTQTGGDNIQGRILLGYFNFSYIGPVYMVGPSYLGPWKILKDQLIEGCTVMGGSARNDADIG